MCCPPPGQDAPGWHTLQGEHLQKLPGVLGADGAAEFPCPAKDRAEQRSEMQMAERWSTEGAGEGHCCSTELSRLSAQRDAPACLVTNLLPGSRSLAFSLCFEILQASECSGCLWPPRSQGQEGFPRGLRAFPADPSLRIHPSIAPGAASGPGPAGAHGKSQPPARERPAGPQTL